MADQMALFDDTELLPLFAGTPQTVEVDPFESGTDVDPDPSEQDNFWTTDENGKWVFKPSAEYLEWIACSAAHREERGQ